VRNVFVAPIRHGSGESHRLNGCAPGIHIRDLLLQIDDPVGKRSLEARLRLDVKTFFCRAIFYLEAWRPFGEDRKRGLLEKMCLNMDGGRIGYTVTCDRSLLSWIVWANESKRIVTIVELRLSSQVSRKT
jgi:hypothetical protein